MDDVYVPLGLVERKKPSKPQDDISPEQGSELYKETEITKTFEHDVFLVEVLKQKNTPKSQGKRIAIIGEPGAGKTTLLQQIADWVFREIDQSIVIWVSLADLREKEIKSYLFETWLTQVAEKTGKAEATKQLKDNFVALFNQNKVWLLLDGLDEMSASSGNPLTEIARQFREAGLIFQARIVLTCRINLWDGSINALDDFDTYRSLDFTYPQQVERFIHKWFAAIPETAKQLCTALKESGKERIQDLVKNPLRLTLLCLNWQWGDGKLPDTQAGLYQQFVDDFYKWKKEEFAINSDQRQQLNIKLGELAKTAIDKEANRFRLRQDFVTQFLGDADDESSLLKLALNRGWLNCIGIDSNRKPVYAFFHASFQEYFAAKAINDWHFFLKHVPKNPHQGTYRIFEPQWKQTILLWLGRPEENLKQQKQQFIEALINFQDRCDKYRLLPTGKGFYEYQAYFLAAAGITEFRDYFRADKIVKQIINWTITDSISLIREEAKSVLQQTDRTKAIATLVELLQSNDVDDDTRLQAAYNLGEIDPGNQIAITTLVELLQSNDVDDDTRCWVAYNLGEIDPGNEIAIAALVELLQSTNVDDRNRKREYVAKSLGKIGTGNKIAIAALVEQLQLTDLDYRICKQVAESLEKIDPGNEIAIATLVQLLQSTNVSDDTRKQIAKSLGLIGKGNKVAIAALVQLLQSTNIDDYTRKEAATSLGEIDPGNEIAIAALVKLLQSSHLDDEILFWVTFSLGRTDPGNEIAIAAFVQMVKFQCTTQHHSLEPYILWRIAIGNTQVIAILLQLLQINDLDEMSFSMVANILARIAVGNSQAIAAFEQLLHSNSMNDANRQAIASSLGQIDAGNEIAIAALIQMLQSNDVYKYTRIKAAESLEKIDTTHEKLIAALVQLLQSKDLDKDICPRVAQILGKIGTDNEKVIDTLVQILKTRNVDDDDYTIIEAANSLGKIGKGNETAIIGLVQLLQSNHLNSYVYFSAVSSLGIIGTGNEIAITALVEMLQSTTVSGSTRCLAAKNLGGIIRDNNHRFKAVKALSSYWGLNDEYYDLAWECAQNMPYPDFYQAWHQHNFATRAIRTLKRILFTET